MNSKMKRAIEDNRRYGEFWFSKETMKFWNSKVEAGMFDNDTFVTSEDNFDRSKKLYSVRRYDWGNHTVETITFQQHNNLSDAIRFAEECEGDEQ